MANMITKIPNHYSRSYTVRHLNYNLFQILLKLV